MNMNEHTGKLLPLTIGAIGVVYGDVGTSPLYAMKEIFNGPHAVAPTQSNILGILSLVFWALIFVISLKYVVFVMRADNRGEGGIMALMALALRRRHRPLQHTSLVVLGLMGTALFYGDGVITPAISVLSAVEGLQVATPALQAYVIPSAIAILCALFLVQSYGTAGVGLLFGPIMCIWFAVLAILGWANASHNPEVWQALNPLHAFDFCRMHGWHAFLALGAVVLALTGAEALYADMGHFGKWPIRAAWFSLVLPALTLNYLGQGALIMRQPSAIENPFYLMAPSWALYPLVGLATIATVIASQAVISGAFSITLQAMRMDYIPRMRWVHTSVSSMGQIYVPAMNRALFVVVIGTVLSFRSSGNLAAAYGIAVTGTMIITTLLAWIVALDTWKWPPRWTAVLAGGFLLADLAFFSANLLKIPQGGWFPLVLGGVLFASMSTWRRGRETVLRHLQMAAVSLTGFLAELRENPPLFRPSGTAVFMTSRQLSMPHALQRNYEHNRVLHERVILLTIVAEDIPYIPENERLEIEDMAQGFYRITAKYGFMEAPDVREIMRACGAKGLQIELRQTSFFIGRETLIPSPKPDLNFWQEKIFLFLFRNTSTPIQFYNLPPERVVELGAQFEI